jgi:glutamate 5-kinase
MKKKLIIKIGTSTLTAGTNRISFAVIESLARQIVELKKDYEIVIVSSGAIATARQFVEISGYQKRVDSKQAMAAIGQTKLMELYDGIFRTFGLNIAQILLTYRDFENPVAIENTRNTINRLVTISNTSFNIFIIKYYNEYLPCYTLSRKTSINTIA